MFGIFNSARDWIVTARIRDMLAPLGELPSSIYHDPYCLGFLQIVGMHAASSVSKNLTHKKAALAFENALHKIAPAYAADAATLLASIKSEQSPHNEAYLRGRKDGDTFMGYRLHRLASQAEGDAALGRFSDHVRRVKSKEASQLDGGTMRVDFSEWYTDRPGLVARKYTYSQMGNTRETELEVHFDIQSGVSVHSFVTFFVSDLDLPKEISVRVSLRPMDNSGSNVIMNMIGRPDGSGAVLGLMSRNDAEQCLKLFFEGKSMHFEVDTADGEKLIRLPLPNDSAFQTAYKASYEKVRAADGLSGADQLLGRIDRFKNELDATHKFRPVPPAGETKAASENLHRINIELRDCSSPAVSTSMSLTELRSLSEPERVKAIQQQITFFADVLRKNEIDAPMITAAMLGAGTQAFIENELVKIVERAPKGEVAHAAHKPMQDFFRGVAETMIHQGLPAGLTGVAMLYAATGLAHQSIGANTASEILERLQEQLAEQ